MLESKLQRFQSFSDEISSVQNKDTSFNTPQGLYEIVPTIEKPNSMPQVEG
jgi:hypothetical protein